jgi:sec-independent protein translocase protein TatB
MFDLGWMELIIIGVTALIVVGPKDLPVMFKTVGNFVGKAKRMAGEFKSTIEAAADDTGLKETSELMNNLDNLNDPTKFFKEEVDDTLHGLSIDAKATKLQEPTSGLKKPKMKTIRNKS